MPLIRHLVDLARLFLDGLGHMHLHTTHSTNQASKFAKCRCHMVTQVATAAHANPEAVLGQWL